MQRTYFRLCSLATLLIVSACSGSHSVPQVGHGEARQIQSSASVFPSMTHRVYPLSGNGSGGAFGPDSVQSLAGLPKKSAPIQILPVQHELPADLDARHYGIEPNIIVGRESTFNVPPIVNAQNTLSTGRRTMDIVPQAGFLGAGFTDLSAGTNGTYITSVDPYGTLRIYTMAGSLVSEIDLRSQVYCGPQPLQICSYSGQVINGSQVQPFPNDDRVYYDTNANRWFTAGLWTFATNPVATDVMAVSQSADPTGGWFIYQFPACGQNDPISNDSSDQPHIGFNSQWIVITSACHPSYPSLAVFDKSALYGGSPLNLNGNWFEFADPIENNGNRDNPTLTFAPTINNREYLTASATYQGVTGTPCAIGQTCSEVIYSHIEGSVDAPAFYSGTDAVETGFVASSVQNASTPTCTGCLGSESFGWTHSSNVWSFRSGQSYILSTMVLGDPRFANANQVNAIAISDSGAATSLQIGCCSGWGAMGSEIGMPLVSNVGYNAALIGFDISTGSFYPGVMAAQWNVDTNGIDFLNTLYQGQFTPSGSDLGRWMDFTSVMSPIPGTSNLVVGGHVAAPASNDPQRAVYFSTITTSATPTPQPTPTPERTTAPCKRQPCPQLTIPR